MEFTFYDELIYDDEYTFKEKLKNCKVQSCVYDLFSSFPTTKESWFWEEMDKFAGEWIKAGGSDAEVYFIDDYGLVRFRDWGGQKIMDFQIESCIFDCNIVIQLLDYGDFYTYYLSGLNSQFTQDETEDEFSSTMDIGEVDTSLYEEEDYDEDEEE